MPLAHISIRCVKVNSEYQIQFDGVDVRETCPSVEEAIDRAGRLVLKETRFTLYSESGEATVTGTLYPRWFSD